jgi:hypothetical protein
VPRKIATAVEKGIQLIKRDKPKGIVKRFPFCGKILVVAIEVEAFTFRRAPLPSSSSG